MSDALLTLCSSGKMQPIRDLVGKVAATNTTVLLRGESGVGKEVVARAIHKASPRAAKSRQMLFPTCPLAPVTSVGFIAISFSSVMGSFVVRTICRKKLSRSPGGPRFRTRGSRISDTSWVAPLTFFAIRWVAGSQSRPKSCAV